MHLSIGALKVADFLPTASTGVGLTFPEEICPKVDTPSIHGKLTSLGVIVNDDRSSVHAGFATLPLAAVQLRALARQYRQAAIQLEIMQRTPKLLTAAQRKTIF
ncbi:hypothetical protein [Glutamicibacter creatinolyticus]|uniref:hypothetical protein n=1 Tax=Glutamicibacter creatinolyticus TaxID=162496 RepID=UPI0032165AF2